MWRGKQMMVPRGWCTSQPPRRLRPFRVHRPNRKAECAETCLLRLERGKGCKALPIATWVGAIPPGYPAVVGNAAPLLDTMKLTVLEQYGKGLVQCEAALG